jgi:hypothetical protein
MGILSAMRVIDHAVLTTADGGTSTVTLAVTVPWLRGEPVYHVFHGDGGVLSFHRSYTRADVIGWPNQRHPGRYRHPRPAAAALEDFRLTVDQLRATVAPGHGSSGPAESADTVRLTAEPPHSAERATGSAGPHRRGNIVA